MWTGLDQPTRKRQADHRRQLIKDQIADGTLRIRQATAEELEQWRREREEREQVEVAAARGA
jgi:hypothetical protein